MPFSIFNQNEMASCKIVKGEEVKLHVTWHKKNVMIIDTRWLSKILAF